MTGRTAGRCCTLILAHTNHTHWLCLMPTSKYMLPERIKHTHTHSVQWWMDFQEGAGLDICCSLRRLCVCVCVLASADFDSVSRILVLLFTWIPLEIDSALFRGRAGTSLGLGVQCMWWCVCVVIQRVLNEWVLHKANSFHLRAFLWDKCARVYTNSDQRKTPSVGETQEGYECIFKNFVQPSVRYWQE